MPTLMRFVVIAAILGAIGFTAMVGLAYFVEPDPREMSVTIPPARLQPRR